MVLAMSEGPHDKPTPHELPVPRSVRPAPSPTLKAFPAVRPDGSPPPPAPVEDSNAGPSQRQLVLAVMKLAEQVENLGGDASEVRYLLGMKTDKS